MGKKRKYRKLTPEDHAQFEKTREMLRERIAYHEAKARASSSSRAFASW